LWVFKDLSIRERGREAKNNFHLFGPDVIAHVPRGMMPSSPGLKGRVLDGGVDIN
jgi:hypothetical protein